MNNYQRAKAKRRKRLSTRGVNFTVQKHIVKMFGNDLVKMDECIDAIAEAKVLADKLAAQIAEEVFADPAEGNLRKFITWIRKARGAKHDGQ